MVEIQPNESCFFCDLGQLLDSLSSMHPSPTLESIFELTPSLSRCGTSSQRRARFSRLVVIFVFIFTLYILHRKKILSGASFPALLFSVSQIIRKSKVFGDLLAPISNESGKYKTNKLNHFKKNNKTTRAISTLILLLQSCRHLPVQS